MTYDRPDRSGPDHVVSVLARPDEVGALSGLLMEMDVRLHGKPRRLPGVGLIATFACPDAAVAEAFEAQWARMRERHAPRARS